MSSRDQLVKQLPLDEFSSTFTQIQFPAVVSSYNLQVILPNYLSRCESAGCGKWRDTASNICSWYNRVWSSGFGPRGATPRIGLNRIVDVICSQDIAQQVRFSPLDSKYMQHDASWKYNRPDVSNQVQKSSRLYKTTIVQKWQERGHATVNMVIWFVSVTPQNSVQINSNIARWCNRKQWEFPCIYFVVFSN